MIASVGVANSEETDRSGHGLDLLGHDTCLPESFSLAG